MLINYQNMNASTVEVCSNLAPMKPDADGRYEPDAVSPNLKTIVKEGAFTPIGEFDNAMLFHDGVNIYAYELTDRSVALLCPLSDCTISHAVASNDGTSFTIFTDADPLVIHARDDSGTRLCETLAREFSAMPHLTATAGEPQTATVAMRSLSRTYSEEDDDEVRSSDARTLTADLVAAYRQIANQCAAAGEFIGMCVAYYRVLDSADNVIFVSPRIVIPSQQTGSSVTLEFADTERESVSSYMYTLTGTRLQLVIPAAPAAESLVHRNAARLEVLVSPMLQPYDPSCASDCRRTVGQEYPAFAVLRLPGSSYGQFSPFSASAAPMIKRLASAEDYFRVVAVVDDPFGAAAGSTIGISSPALSIETELSNLKAVVAEKVITDDGVKCRISAPHRLIPGVMASASGVTLIGGIRAERFRGYELPALAIATSGEEAWQSVVTTVFTDGTRISMPAEGTADAPLTISPLITYPSPDVASIAIQLQVQGSALRVMSIEMEPDATHSRSVFVASDLKSPAWREVEGTLTVPEDTVEPLSFPTAVAVCGNDPLMCVHTVAQVSGGVKCLLPAARSLGAWDFGRVRFLCGGDGGIHALTVSADRKKTAVNLLDNRPVTDTDGMTYMLDGEVAAIAGTDLVSIKGSTVTTRVADIGLGKLGWNAPLRELWHLPADDSEADVLLPQLNYEGYTTIVGVATSVVTTPGVLFLFTEDGIITPGIDGDEQVTVAWRGAFPGPWSGVKRVVLPLSATYFDGIVTITHFHLPADIAVIGRFAISGSVHSPLVLAINTPPADVLKVTVVGTASADFLLRKPSIR